MGTGSRSRLNRKLAWGLACGALGVAVSLLLGLAGVLSPLENATYDWRVRGFPPDLEPDPPIVLVLVDQKSLDYFVREMGMGWPWRRDVYGALVQALEARGARAVAFDIRFTEASPHWPEDDEALVGATREHGPVYHCYDALVEPPDEVRMSERDDAFVARRALDVRDRSTIPWLEVNQLVPPFAALEESAHALGTIRFIPDGDGKARSVGLLFRRGEAFLPFLSLMIAHDLLADGPVEVDEKRNLHVGGRSVPLDPRGRMLIRFLGPKRTFPSKSAHAVISDFVREQEGEEPQFDWGEVDGAVVLVGTTVEDLKHTPHRHAMPGVELHANVLAGLLGGVAVRQTPGWVAPVISALLTLVAGLGIVLGGHPVRAAAATLVLAALYVAASIMAFASGGLWLPVAMPLAALGVTLVVASLASYALEGRERRFLRKAFGHYLAPQVIEALVRDPSQLRLGGERCELSIFFSDLQGFTSFSERLQPEELVHVLIRYLSEMTRSIIASGGTLDKYIGDAIMAFWGAPLPIEDHAVQASLTALDNLKRLDAMAPELEKTGAGRLRVRIGLNTGPAVVGNMGSEQTFNYTAMGDSVNLASRLEGLNKEYGTSIMGSESTRRAAGDSLLWRELDLVRVKGKETAVGVYELLCRREEASQVERDLVAIQDEALALYRGREFKRAADLWQRALQLRPGDGPASVMMKRATVYTKLRPPEDWQGEYIMTTK